MYVGGLRKWPTLITSLTTSGKMTHPISGLNISGKLLTRCKRFVNPTASPWVGSGNSDVIQFMGGLNFRSGPIPAWINSGVCQFSERANPSVDKLRSGQFSEWVNSGVGQFFGVGQFSGMGQFRSE